jgi:ABC-type siderophore export system fused ATPase/permease subunit
MKLHDLIIQVKEKNLSKDQLEEYRNDMSQVFAEMNLEMAELEKAEALFMEKTDTTVARAKVLWKATPEGQRLIVLKRYCLATKELLNSLKSRLYSIY